MCIMHFEMLLTFFENYSVFFNKQATVDVKVYLFKVQLFKDAFEYIIIFPGQDPINSGPDPKTYLMPTYL